MASDISGDAFASVYDEYEKLSRENPIDISRRNLIRKHIESYLQPTRKILEINAGSGIDALYFATKGYDVLATDISEKAGIYIQNKIAANGLANLRFKQCAFAELSSLGPEKFDYIFSNYGGLNCTDDLSGVFSQFDDLLNPGGFVSLVIMPKYYPWEMLTILKGNKNAFRRMRKNVVVANVGGNPVATFYHSPKKVKTAFPGNFRHLKTTNIGTFYPSAHFTSLHKFKNLIARLIKFDEWINSSPLMAKGIGDYFIITFQKNPETIRTKA